MSFTFYHQENIFKLTYETINEICPLQTMKLIDKIGKVWGKQFCLSKENSFVCFVESKEVLFSQETTFPLLEHNFNINLNEAH